MGRGRAPCCEKIGLKRGSWTPAEDMRLMAYIQKHGHSNWRALPKLAGLLRCGKSCRLRWINYLRPDIKRGNFTKEEEETVIKLHEMLGNKWSKIASRLSGRTDNEIKNVWNTHLKKRVASSSKEQSPTIDKLKEPPGSPSSNSSISYCNQGDGAGLHPESEPTDPAHPLEITCEEESSDDIIEIPIEPNLDMWDMLEEASPRAPNGANNKDMNMWEFVLEGPCLPNNEPNESLSSSSSFSDLTYCNNPSERSMQLVPPHPAHRLECGGGEDSIDPILDIPIESDLWNVLEVLDGGGGDDSLFASTAEGREAHEEPVSMEEVESNKWIAYLEKELDLWGATNEGSHESPVRDAAEPPPQSGRLLLDVDMDPVASYFQKQPPSPSPFTLSFLDLSMT